MEAQLAEQADAVVKILQANEEKFLSEQTPGLPESEAAVLKDMVVSEMDALRLKTRAIITGIFAKPEDLLKVL